MNEFEQNISAERLLEVYSDMVYTLAYSRTRNRHDAEDITQEVFLKYIKSGKRFSDEEHRKAWLLKVTVNSAKTFVGQAWFRHRADIEEAENAAESDSDSASPLLDAVSELPEKYRTAVHLFYYENLSVEQISEIMNSKPNTVKSYLHRARAMLKEILKEGDYGYEYEF